MNKYNAVQKLIQLDHDMVKAYDTAIAASDREETKVMLSEFRDDHVRHTDNLGAVLHNFDKNVPDGPDVFRFLTQGRVILANFVGLEYDSLLALSSNAGMITNAYDEVLKLDNLDAAMLKTLQANRDDIVRHQKCLTERCSTISEATATT